MAAVATKPEVPGLVAAPQTPRGSRVLALDCLRGFAILGFILAALLPEGLPAWMAMTGSRVGSPFGLSWVDLLLPILLFTVGAAIPSTLGSRIERSPRFDPFVDQPRTDVSAWRIVAGIAWLGLALGLTAIAVRHLMPGPAQGRPVVDPWVSLLGFVCLSVAVTRKPSWVPRTVGAWLRLAAIVAVLLVLARYRFVSQPSSWASAYRFDPVLMTVANCVVSGALIWLVSRQSLLLRIAVLALIAMVFLAREAPGISWTIWNWHRLSPFVSAEYHRYLIVVLAGTIAGEALRRPGDAPPDLWARWRLWATLACLAAAVVLALMGITRREQTATTVALAALGLFAMNLTQRPFSQVERTLWALVRWGTAFLVLGLVAEPLGGGMRPDSPPTLSYLLTTSGLSFYALAGLLIVCGLPARSALSGIAMVGQNPLLGYLVAAVAAPAFLAIVGFEPAREVWLSNPWALSAAALAMTTACGLGVSLLTRAGVRLP